MTDNVTVDNADLTDFSVASDDVGGDHFQRVKVDVGGDGVSSPLVRGQQAKANSIPVTLASDEDNVNADIQSLPNTVEADITAIKTAIEILDNAISGTEIQADVLTLPDVDINDISKGTQTNDLKVTLDSEAVTINQFSASTATEGSYSVTTSSTEVLATNASRKGGYLQNVSDTDIYISLGGTATTSLTKIFAGGGTLSLIVDGVNVFTGAVTAIHAGSGSKSLVYVEL